MDSKVLEFLLIPEGEELTIANEQVNTIENQITSIFVKIGKLGRSFIPKSDKSYQYLADFIQSSANPNKLTNDDIIKLHDFYYDESLALTEFAPSKEPEVIKLIKKYKPVPIYSMGNGDFYCVVSGGAIKEYIHDTISVFDSKYAKDYKNYKDWFKNFYMNTYEYKVPLK